MTTCCCSLVRKLLTMPAVAIALLGVSLVSLAAAFVAQHYFDISPCILCLFQRVPYAVVIVLASLALLFRHDNAKVKVMLGLSALAYFVNVGIAFFHTGVERHWWAGTNGCSVTPLNATASREQLLKMAVAQCDEINFEIFGLTFANLNVALCLVLGVVALLAVWRVGKAEPEDSSCGCRCHCTKS